MHSTLPYHAYSKAVPDSSRRTCYRCKSLYCEHECINPSPELYCALEPKEPFFFMASSSSSRSSWSILAPLDGALPWNCAYRPCQYRPGVSWRVSLDAYGQRGVLLRLCGLKVLRLGLLLALLLACELVGDRALVLWRMCQRRLSMASRELSSYWSRWQGESWAGRPCSAPCRQFQSPCSSPAQLSASNTRQALKLAPKTYLVTGLIDAALANVGCAAHFDCVFGICRKSKCRS